MHSIGNTVNNTVAITMYGARLVLEILGGTPVKYVIS